MAKDKNGTAPVEPKKFDTATLYGDIRQAILDGFRHMQKPYQQMSQDEQKALIDSCGQVAQHLVNEAVRIVAAESFPVINGKLVKAQIKDGMQLQVDVSRHDPQRLTIIDSVTRPVLLVIPEPEMFMGEADKPKPDAKTGAEAQALATPIEQHLQ